MKKRISSDKKSKAETVLDYYYDVIVLKKVIRTGWKYWNVSGGQGRRIESIAEHIYGTQQLALAIYSEYNLDIDISKVIFMLSMHETEEVDMGDKTDFDGISEKEKLALGKNSVDKVFTKLSKKEEYTAIIDEFNERKTKEAYFAYLCDKLECDLQAKEYSDTNRCSFLGVDVKVFEDSRVQKSIADGARTVANVFLDYDMPKYEESEVFKEIAEFTRKYKIKQI